MATCPTFVVTEVTRSGHSIVLDDGTVWEVFYRDAVKSRNWPPRETRVVRRDDYPGIFIYQTVFQREGKGDWVRALRGKKRSLAVPGG
ncbi:MAG: hypothetical protein OXM02_00975 [Bacteroidota bacterium]|nr:hypothetical protein [Bacteroidota bacterium]MDE2957855.1 hypothetical protein [Bacteroidota bacterium]